jgi:hypothetical protein
MDIQTTTDRVNHFHDSPPSLLLMGYKVIGMVVTQLGFEIPMRDQDSADRGAGKGQTDYCTGLKTLNLIVLQPPSPHQYNTSVTAVGQAVSLLGVENPSMSDYCDRWSVSECPKTDDLQIISMQTDTSIWSEPSGM